MSFGQEIVPPIDPIAITANKVNMPLTFPLKKAIAGG